MPIPKGVPRFEQVTEKRRRGEQEKWIFTFARRLGRHARVDTSLAGVDGLVKTNSVVRRACWRESQEESLDGQFYRSFAGVPG
jgi:hypothetical protein